MAMTHHPALSNDPEHTSVNDGAHELIRVLYPVRVKLPNGTELLRAKIWHMVGGVLVLAERADGSGPFVAFTARHAGAPTLAPSTLPRRRQSHTWRTDAGQLTAQGVLGCGCGSALKTMSFEEALKISRR